MMDTGSGSELCITGVSEESAVGRKSALLELEGEEGDMGWIGIWMSWSCGLHIQMGDCLDVDVPKAMLSPTSKALQECQPALTSQYKTLFLVDSLLFLASLSFNLIVFQTFSLLVF